jgi:cob(I)alamin adenosyltransferase
MLYTGKGDNGTTKLFNTPQGVRISKSSNVFEALGTIDELNSFLGIVKVYCAQTGYGLEAGGSNKSFEGIVHNVQENLFIVQAELAGSEMAISETSVSDVENLIASIENNLPPIKTFFISGGTLLAAHFDTARTIARRAERRVVTVHEDYINTDENNINKINASTLAYLNRLSSLLYALARYSNHFAGITETAPKY